MYIDIAQFMCLYEEDIEHTEPKMELSPDFQSNKKKFYSRLNTKFLDLNAVLVLLYKSKCKKTREITWDWRTKQWYSCSLQKERKKLQNQSNIHS